MDDLISRSALLERAMGVVIYDEGGWDCNVRAVPVDEVLNSPAVDAVEVVRCKDCKHYHDFETHFDCNHVCGMDYVQPTDFCSYGERRENHDE